MGVLPILKAVYGTSFQMAEKAPPDLILVAVDEPPDRFLNSERLRGRRAVCEDLFPRNMDNPTLTYGEQSRVFIRSERMKALLDLWGRPEICLLSSDPNTSLYRMALLSHFHETFGCRTFELRFSKEDAIPVGADQGRLF